MQTDTPEWISDASEELEACAGLCNDCRKLGLEARFHCAYDFYTINCTRSPPVVEERPWAESYVALSYVWGPPSGDWPPTILNAVEVTKRLEEKYLWVDRLCVNRSNAKKKQLRKEQIPL